MLGRTFLTLHHSSISITHFDSSSILSIYVEGNVGLLKKLGLLYVFSSTNRVALPETLIYVNW
jgi:hypothetical protein